MEFSRKTKEKISPIQHLAHLNAIRILTEGSIQMIKLIRLLEEYPPPKTHTTWKSFWGKEEPKVDEPSEYYTALVNSVRVILTPAGAEFPDSFIGQFPNLEKIILVPLGYDAGEKGKTTHWSRHGEWETQRGPTDQHGAGHRVIWTKQGGWMNLDDKSLRRTRVR